MMKQTALLSFQDKISTTKAQMDICYVSESFSKNIGTLCNLHSKILLHDCTISITELE